MRLLDKILRQLMKTGELNAIPMTRDDMYGEEKRLHALEDAPGWRLSRAAE